LLKLIWNFENASTLTEEDFNPTIGDADFGVKVESVKKFQESFYRRCRGSSICGRGLKNPENKIKSIKQQQLAKTSI
jgi:electron transfer flavoprotein alpha subunit